MESLFDQQANMEPTLEDILDSDVFSNSDSVSFLFSFIHRVGVTIWNGLRHEL